MGLGLQIRGYYALPLLWRDQVIGWANVTAKDGRLQPSFGYAGRSPAKDPVFRHALEDELDRMTRFLAGHDAA